MTSKACIKSFLQQILQLEALIFQMLTGLFNMTRPRIVINLCIESVELLELAVVENH